MAGSRSRSCWNSLFHLASPKDCNDGVGASPQVLLYHLLDKPCALGCGRPTFVAKLKAVTLEQVFPEFQNGLLKLIEGERAPRNSPVGGGLMLGLLWFQQGQKEEGEH